MPTTTTVNAWRDELRGVIATLPDLDEADLLEAMAKAAQTYTGMALHHRRPAEKQGDTDAASLRYRAEVQAAAEELWLAARAEDDRRLALERRGS